MVEAWILVVFCLWFLPLAAIERRNKYVRNTKYAERSLQPRIQRVKEQRFTAVLR